MVVRCPDCGLPYVLNHVHPYREADGTWVLPIGQPLRVHRIQHDGVT